MKTESPPTQHHMVPPKRVKLMVVQNNKKTRQVVQIELDNGPPAKRTQSSEANPEIIMTITQPVNSSKAKRDKPRTKKPPPHSKAQEAGASQTPASIVCPPSGVQHTSTAAPIPGQQLLQLSESSPPWWSWGPPLNPWNWNMWLPGAFHQTHSCTSTRTG